MSEAQRRGWRPGRRTLGRILGLTIAALLIAFVIKSVPWEDELTLRDAQADVEESYSGTIVGAWKSTRVSFRFDQAQPGALASRHELGATITGQGEVEVDSEADTIRSSLLGEVVDDLEVEWRPGMPRVFQDLEVRLLVPALGFLFLATLFIVTRWWRLLLLAACPTSWFEAFRLTYVGLFFNTILPGSTGGDLVRAYVVVRDHPERRANALTSVGADRVLGLVGMALVSVTAIWTAGQEFAELRVWVLLAGLALVGGLLAFVNPFLRRLVPLDWILSKLPQGERIAKVDLAMRAHARHPGTVALTLLLSVGNHLCATACCYFIGHALGDDHGFHTYLCVVTVANTVSSLPLSPGGLGVGEVAYGTLLFMADGLYMIGVAISIVYRLCLILIGLGGGVVLLLPGGAQVRTGLAQAREDGTDSEVPTPPSD